MIIIEHNLDVIKSPIMLSIWAQKVVWAVGMYRRRNA